MGSGQTKYKYTETIQSGVYGSVIKVERKNKNYIAKITCENDIELSIYKLIDENKLKKFVTLKEYGEDMSMDDVKEITTHQDILSLFEIMECDRYNVLIIEQVIPLDEYPLDSLDDKTANKMIYDMYEGVMEALSIGVVPSDLKTDNVGIDENGRIKYFDLGMYSLKKKKKMDKIKHSKIMDILDYKADLFDQLRKYDIFSDAIHYLEQISDDDESGTNVLDMFMTEFLD